MQYRYSLTDEEYKFLEEHFEKPELLWKYKRALEEADEEKEEKFKYINLYFELQKSFEDSKKERDCQIAEYQKKIKELEKKSDFYFPEEPIKIADLIIHGWETSWDYKHLSISELKQIAEHLLVYCNHNGEVEE